MGDDEADDRAKVPARQSSPAEVAAFLAQARSLRQGGARRLLFALDATASRQPSWDRAAHLQTEMFTAAAALGGIEIQLAYYRGFGEFRVGPWLEDGRVLLRMMSKVSCLSGRTQLGKVLQHAINEANRRPIAALVFVGDCVEEGRDGLYGRAGELGLLGVPGFFFLEGDNPVAHTVFSELARLTGGAFCRFDEGSADALRTLLRAVATYAAGGHAALAALARQSGGETALIARQLARG